MSEPAVICDWLDHGRCRLGFANGSPTEGFCQQSCGVRTSRPHRVVWELKNGQPQPVMSGERLVTIGGGVPATATSAPPPQPVPREQWPLWTRFVAPRAKPSDRGVGDTVARLLGEYGEAFKREMKKHEIDCGCSARQAEWNAKYPYSWET